ncbi:MAG: SMI1/KNR4 family protein [Rhodobacterales bacterium]|nr:SMI1/KNR4 family protein [Rhodobacterales bacterium]
MRLAQVIDLINQADDPAGRKKPLPDDTLVDKYEQLIGLPFPEDYRTFLKSVSNAFVGYMSPFSLREEPSEDYRDLYAGVNAARKAGVPGHWLPICEDNGDYYCLVSDGTVRFWDHNGPSQEEWPDLATWAYDVWLEGG